MTSNQFRQLALSLPDVVENAHMKHPDFRANGKIFATLSYPDEQWAMVKLSLEDQEEFMREEPDMFVPANGAWGRKGCTHVILGKASQRDLKAAIVAAWRNYAPDDVALAGLKRKMSKRAAR